MSPHLTEEYDPPYKKLECAVVGHYLSDCYHIGLALSTSSMSGMTEYSCNTSSVPDEKKDDIA